MSRKALNIEGLGKQLIEQCVDQGLLHDVVDIYALDFDSLMNLERMGEKSANNCLVAIEASKTVDLGRFIYALGLPYVGVHGAAILAQEFGSIFELKQASFETLQEIHGIGDKMAASVIRYFQDPRFCATLDLFVQRGLNIQSPSTSINTGKLSGKTVLFTGTLMSLKRVEAEELVRSAGGKIGSSITKNLSMLVVGENAGSKLEKAKKLITKGAEIQILSEDMFQQLFNND